MIWARVSDGTETKRLAFQALPRQGEELEASISTPDYRRHRVITVVHSAQLDPTILVARIEGGGNDS
jgi:hypothetical protein